MSARTTRLFLERYEGGLAVLLLGEQGEIVMHLPRRLLPPNAPEGTVLTLTLAVDADATAAARREVEALMGELEGGGRDA